MSQFDFPRINFNGSARINPSSGNNNTLLPLVMFDAARVKAIIPPRIYCEGDLLASIKLDAIKLPETTKLKEDDFKAIYFEIHSVNSVEKFQEWATTPLGSCSTDHDYHYLYSLIRTRRSKEPLTGKLPGGWNYYGGLEFGFDDVSVVSIDTNPAFGEFNNFNTESGNIPLEIKELLNAKIDFGNEKGTNTAVMIDVVPELAFYSQIFADQLRIFNDEGNLFSGKPGKASLRNLNSNRVLNLEGAVAASGTFFTCIEFNDAKPDENSKIENFFIKNGIHKSNLKGIFIRFNLYEVIENDPPDYSTLGKKGNPALCKVTGSISPWYEGEMKSVGMGRIMIPSQPIYGIKTLCNFVFSIDEERNAIQMDWCGFVPQLLSKEKNSFETYNLGRLELVAVTGEDEIVVADIIVNNNELPINKIINCGGMVELPLKVDASKITNDTFFKLILTSNKDGLRQEVMTENEWMMMAENSGLYVQQFANAENGYSSNSFEKEPCTFEIYRYGKKVDYAIPMHIKRIKLKSTLMNAEIESFLTESNFNPDYSLIADTTFSGSEIYIFYPGVSVDMPSNPIADLLKTGFFVNVRILPTQNYEKYLNPEHPEYIHPIPFEVIYKEFLQVFNVIYPWSGIVTPFTEAYFTRGWKHIKSRLNPENWNSYQYMPTTRDMSENLYKLICKWGRSL